MVAPLGKAPDWIAIPDCSLSINTTSMPVLLVVNAPPCNNLTLEAINNVLILLTVQEPAENEVLLWVGRLVDPLYGMGAGEYELVHTTINGQDVVTGQLMTIKNETFFCSIGSNVFYAALFYVFGLIIFRKRDIK